MFIKNEYSNIHEECFKESNNDQNIKSVSRIEYCTEFVSIKCEIVFEKLSSDIKEELLSDDEGTHTENVDSKNLFLQDDKPNSTLLKYSNFTSTLYKKETSMSAYTSDDTESDVTVTPIIKKISKNVTCNQGCLLCQRKNENNKKCNLQVYNNFPCHMCTRISKETASFRKKDISMEKQFWCDMCNKRFQCRSTIIRHMQVHNANKQYSCKICSKKFSCAGLIKPHMRLHTGEKPYICSVCEKRFSHKCNMQRHTERHKKVKNLKCPVCNKIFAMESRLKYHMRTHTNEKPFKCDICKKKFSHKQNIQRHYTAKHPWDKFNGTETDASVARIVWDKIVNKVVELLPN